MSVSTVLPPVAMVRVAARLVARRRSVGRPRMQFRRRVDGVSGCSSVCVAGGGRALSDTRVLALQQYACSC